jgi:hypothetical protein
MSEETSATLNPLRPTAVEFREIGHAGGTVTFKGHLAEDGEWFYSVGIAGSRPVPMTMIGLWALYPGMVVASLPMGGIGSGIPAPPLPGCLPVYIVGDSEGRFGHHCPRCGEYWRSGPWPNVCPYCAVVVQSHNFLSEAQRHYVQRYCALLHHWLVAKGPEEAVIDMDEVADAVGKEGEKPDFYVSEVSQQCKFVCEACEEFNDILGRFGYCSLCGTRNDLYDFLNNSVPSIRNRLNGGGRPEDAIRDAVASFETMVGQFAKQLAELATLSAARRSRLKNQRFHNLAEVIKTFSDWFDIDIDRHVKEADVMQAEVLFFRRHVYEHNGGEVDQKYLDDSGDTSVRLKQHIHETQGDVQKLLSTLCKMAGNLQQGFHELFPPLASPIKAYADKKERIEKYSRP